MTDTLIIILGVAIVFAIVWIHDEWRRMEEDDEDIGRHV